MVEKRTGLVEGVRQGKEVILTVFGTEWRIGRVWQQKWYHGYILKQLIK